MLPFLTFFWETACINSEPVFFTTYNCYVYILYEYSIYMYINKYLNIFIGAHIIRIFWVPGSFIFCWTDKTRGQTDKMNATWTTMNQDSFKNLFEMCFCKSLSTPWVCKDMSLHDMGGRKKVSFYSFHFSAT